MLSAGMQAPDFTLQARPGAMHSLSEHRGKNVVLVFYPADWSPVCGDQMALYNEVLPTFHKMNAEVLGISVDGAWCHEAYAESRKLKYPLLSDFEPKGAVARLYDVYRSEDGTSERALFVLDKNGIIRWGYCSPVDTNPGADGILDALENLQEGHDS